MPVDTHKVLILQCIWVSLCLIAYICGFRKDRQMIEYTKDQWIYQNHHDVLQWYINAQNIICLWKLIEINLFNKRITYLIYKWSFYQYQLCDAMLTILKNQQIPQMLNQITILNLAFFEWIQLSISKFWHTITTRSNWVYLFLMSQIIHLISTLDQHYVWKLL